MLNKCSLSLLLLYLSLFPLIQIVLEQHLETPYCIPLSLHFTIVMTGSIRGPRVNNVGGWQLKQSVITSVYPVHQPSAKWFIDGFSYPPPNNIWGACVVGLICKWGASLREVKNLLSVTNQQSGYLIHDPNHHTPCPLEANLRVKSVSSSSQEPAITCNPYV